MSEVDHFGNVFVEVVFFTRVFTNCFLRVDLTADVDTGGVRYFLDVVAEVLELQVQVF